MPKTWCKKLEVKKSHKIVTLAHAFGGIPENETMFVATPQLVADMMTTIDYGVVKTRKEFRDMLAAKYNTYGTCPLSTAIFIRIVAEAMYEKYTAGVAIEELVPFWRVIDTKGEKKYSFPLEFVDQRRREEQSSS